METAVWWRQFRIAALLTLPIFLSEPTNQLASYRAASAAAAAAILQSCCILCNPVLRATSLV